MDEFDGVAAPFKKIISNLMAYRMRGAIPR
jgi:hypothetical protein